MTRHVVSCGAVLLCAALSFSVTGAAQAAPVSDTGQRQVVVAPDGKAVFTAQQNSADVLEWNPFSGQRMRSIISMTGLVKKIVLAAHPAPGTEFGFALTSTGIDYFNTNGARNRIIDDSTITGEWLSPDDTRLYYATPSALTTIDATTGHVIGSASLSAAPTQVLISPDADSVLVVESNSKNILQLNSHTGQAITTIPMTGVVKKVDFAANFDSNYWGPNFQLGVAATDQGVDIFGVGSSSWVQHIVSSPNIADVGVSVDRSRLGFRVHYESPDGITTIDVAGNDPTASTSTRGTPVQVAPTPDGESEFVVQQHSADLLNVDAHTGDLTSTLTMTGIVKEVVLTAHQQPNTGFALTSAGIDHFNTNGERNRIIDDSSITGEWLSPDDALLYYTTPSALTAIDTTTGQVVSSVPLG